MQPSSSPFSLFGKARRTKFGIGTTLFLLAFGVIFIGVSSIFLKDDVRSRNWPSVEGMVSQVNRSTSSDGDVMYSPTVMYTVDGQSYSVKQSFSSSEVASTGDRRSIRYDPADPSEGIIAISGTTMFLYLFPLVGAAVIVWAIVGFIVSLKRGAGINRLKQTGIKLQGVITGVENTGRNGAVRIGVSATDQSGHVRTFVSDGISGNTFSLVNYQTNPIAMDVYIDAANPNNYYVDLDDVPSLSPEKIAELLKTAVSTKPFGAAAQQTSTAPVSPAPATPIPMPGSNPAGTDNTTVPPANNYR